MTMMKAVLLMIILLLAACGSGGEPPQKSPRYITLADGTRCVVLGNSIDCEDRK